VVSQIVNHELFQNLKISSHKLNIITIFGYMKNYEYLNKVLLVFRDEYKESLQGCEHSDTGITPWHMEGDVFTHTMMVLREYIRLEDTILPGFERAILIAVLCHDLGKPFSKSKPNEKGKTYMTGHELISAMMTIDFIDRHNDTLDLEDYEIDLAIKGVLGHTLMHSEDVIYNTKGADYVATIVNKCDHYGRIHKDKGDK